MDHRESSVAHELLAMSQEERLHSAVLPRQPSQDTASSHSIAKSDRDKYTSPNPPESITPPPSSQIPPAPPSRTSIRTPTPPTPVLSSPPPTSRPSTQLSGPALTFTLEQVTDATADELRDMVGELMVALRESRTSSAHHKLQYNMLCLDSVEAQNRMAVELAMAQREVEVLQQAEERRRNEIASPHQSIQQQTVSPANAALLNEMSRHIQILQNENEELRDMVDHSKRVTERREGEIATLVEENERLRGRIRKNRDHLNGLLGDVYDTTSPMSITSTPRYPNTPRSRARGQPTSDPSNRGQQAFEALLLADKMLSEKTTTAPTTPTRGNAPKARFSHTRGAQSLSSIPATPNSRSRPAQQQPSTVAVPRTPPSSFRPAAQAPRSAPAANVPKQRRRGSTDSTITASSIEGAINESDKDTEIDESQASQMASNLLRRTPQHYTMGGSPHASQSQSKGQRGTSVQARLFGQVKKPGVGRPAEKEKRSISGVEDSGTGNAAKRSRTSDVGIGLGIGGMGSSSPKRS